MAVAAREVMVTELQVDAKQGEAAIERWEAKLGRAASTAEKARRGNDGLGKSFEGMSAPLRMAARSFEAQERQMSRLVQRYDPASAAAKRLAEAEAFVSNSMRRGRSVAAEHIRTLERLRAEHERLAASATQSERATSRMGDAMNMMVTRGGAVLLAIEATRQAYQRVAETRMPREQMQITLSRLKERAA